MKAPTKEDVFSARCAVGHTQAVAARVINVSMRSYQDWEGGIRPMPVNLYRLYLHLTGQVPIQFGEAIRLAAQEKPGARAG